LRIAGRRFDGEIFLKRDLALIGRVRQMQPRFGIGALLDAEGSDKGLWYGGLYGVLLEPSREQIRCVVEIGIGTVIPEVASTMFGIGNDNYRPGGSLRAWRDFLPNAAVHGVDVAADLSTLVRVGSPRIFAILPTPNRAPQCCGR
jgi:hypothetical protein